MGWPYGGHEFLLMYGIQPDYATWVQPTIPIGITDSPDLSANTNTVGDYGIGDYAPLDIKAGPLDTTGRIRMRLLPYAMYFLQSGIRNAILGHDLPFLTIGLACVQGGASPQFRDIHVGCKISDLRVSSAERERVTADVGWQALYPLEDGLGLPYAPPTGAPLYQFPITWHEVEVRFPDGAGGYEYWSVTSPSLQWTVRNTIRAHYGQGLDPLPGFEPESGAATHPRGPRFLKETTHALGLQFQARSRLSPRNVTSNPLTNMPSIIVNYIDSISGYGFATELTYAKWSAQRQGAISADGLETWTMPGLARGINIY